MEGPLGWGVTMVRVLWGGGLMGWGVLWGKGSYGVGGPVGWGGAMVRGVWRLIPMGWGGYGVWVTMVGIIWGGGSCGVGGAVGWGSYGAVGPVGSEVLWGGGLLG